MTSQNKFYEKEDCIIGVTADGTEFLFDKKDLDLVKQFIWHVNTGGYIRTNDFTFKIQLHRMILNLEDPKLIVDHINGNPLDNRKSNLRVCTRQENCRNQNLHSNNKSGYKGVYWSKEHAKWRAGIMINRKSKHIGLYETKEEAARAYNEKALFYFGEYAKLNEV